MYAFKHPYAQFHASLKIKLNQIRQIDPKLVDILNNWPLTPWPVWFVPILWCRSIFC